MDELTTTPDQKTQIGGLPNNLAAALCYIPINPLNLIAQIVFIAAEPKDNRFVRFHAFQALFTGIAVFVLIMAAVFVDVVIGVVCGVIGASMNSDALLAIGSSLGALLVMAVAFGAFLISLLQMWRAYQGKQGSLPIVSGLALRFA